MSLFYPFELLLKWLYRFDEPAVVRDRPMQVLALGLSRCGTESLKFALEDLGYRGVYHGFEVKADQCMVWSRLWDAKAAHASDMKIETEVFDKLIGNYEAVTDAPCNMFGKELIEAYPDAKVILNRRKDVDAWDQSFRSALLKTLRDSWWLKALSIFSPDYFWLRQITLRYVIGYFNGSFEKHGLDVYRAHYRQLEDMMGEGKYLGWTVEDGWEPLCAFLGKPVPEKAFPSGNAPPAFVKRIAELRKPQYRHALVNVAKTLGVVIAAGVAVWMAYARLN
ncbi:MAG: hypothetical protein ALECFALPRED_010589 [Alectoria fallacina]|uniref:NAD dependent epimerase/dehydratase n=1 Tax=Alectoria fallacina TaxID=1903189 RepID=A0A8H3F1E5_9LECA|nr:MAG: hypothetical protein ALECFALPRED_010589 [Alectoria fallacina]